MPIYSRNDTACPDISVVITTYNRPDGAIRAVRSVMAQSIPPRELIVVDDASARTIRDWLGRQADKAPFPVRFIAHEHNRGLPAARNTGWRAAKGCWVAFLDDDDIWKTDRIESQLPLLEEWSGQPVGACYCGGETHYMQDNVRRAVAVSLPVHHGDLAAGIRVNGLRTIASAAIFSRRALADLGGYDEEMVSSVDHDMWMTLAAGGYAVLAVHKPLVISFDRAGGHSMMSDGRRRIRGVLQFAEKWRPQFRRWFGDAGGDRYTARYVGRVLGMLGGELLAHGRIHDAAHAFAALWRHAGFRGLFVALPVVVKEMLRCWIPPHHFVRLRDLLRR